MQARRVILGQKGCVMCCFKTDQLVLPTLCASLTKFSSRTQRSETLISRCWLPEFAPTTCSKLRHLCRITLQMPLVWNVGEVSKLHWSFGGSGQAAKERSIVGPIWHSIGGSGRQTDVTSSNITGLMLHTVGCSVQTNATTFSIIGPMLLSIAPHCEDHSTTDNGVKNFTNSRNFSLAISWRHKRAPFNN